MSNAESELSEILKVLRSESETLRKLPGNRKGTLPDTRRQELATVVGRALTSAAPFEEVERELGPLDRKSVV